MEARQKVYDHLKTLGIEYKVSEHPAVYTIEEMERLELDQIGAIVKNLFLRDGSGKRHFLVMLRQDKKVDLKDLTAKLETKALKFASADRLEKYLGLEKGAVSPFGVLNDETTAVEVVIDRDLTSFELLGVHPNDNRATVWISYPDLEKVISGRGNPICHLDI